MACEEVGKFGVKENFEWNVENEIKLFEAMIGHKPIGINKHFHMACISEKFESLLGKPVSSDAIWQHLESMYDLAALDKKETLPFPNEPDEFSLPEAEYLDLINEKITSKTDISIDLKDSKEGNQTPKITKDSTPAKEPVVKKDKKLDVDNGVVIDMEKKDASDLESDSQKRKLSKEIKTRGKRSIKDKKGDSDSLTNTTVSKKENSISQHLSKKLKQAVGKRTLRSRADDSLSSKSLTPPPSKRARRL